MSDFDRLAGLLFPDVCDTPEELLARRFPPRALPEGAQVTRFAPSPTGFIHIGNIFGSMVDERLAHQSGGVCILRIEDTDKKREIENGVPLIVRGLNAFGIDFDEGPDADGTERGDYGPYTQSLRGPLYHAFCKELVRRGYAYPCFCSEEELSAVREKQESGNVTPGYWGEYARCRDLPYETVEANVRAGKSYVIRLRSPGKPGGRVKLRDVIRGEIEMEENFLDIVLLKSDGIPTYHFAHIVDDTLMRVTQVVRGDEWIASAPIHLQLFWLMELKPPKYAHISPIMKEDGGSRRKLSKRKDPEAAASYFAEEGYPAQALMEYLLTIANSNFEDWRLRNRDADYTSFPFALKKMSQSGALFDMDKLKSVSAEVIARMTAREVCDAASAWAKERDTELYRLLAEDPAYAERVFAIDRGGKKPRKDITKWSEVRGYAEYFYDALYSGARETEELASELQRQILDAYLQCMDCADDKDAWFGKIRGLCEPLGFSPDVKAYKAAPEQFKGHVGDVSGVIRMALTGRQNTPDLHAIMALLGQARCEARIRAYMETL